ncbi:uncharacterized protein [Diadema setosum]|uniref:uncharacterized protein n=1 Tax=Diadema setosum TaxID=31175 RepID=UPI003B3BA265
MAANQHRQRRPYNCVSNQDRNRIIDAFLGEDLDHLEVAQTLGVNRQTARSIVVVYLQQDRRDARPSGGPNRVKVDQEMRDQLAAMLDDNPLLTLSQMNDELRRRLPQKPAISVSTLARTLDEMLVTIKLAEDVPGGRNKQRTLDRRAEYAQWFLHDGVLGHCIYIHECGFNIWTRRSYGRAARAEPLQFEG